MSTRTAEIFTKQACPWCVKAKQALSRHGIAYTEHHIGSNGVTKETIEQKIGSGAVVKTVPQIFVDGKYIGGCTELLKHLGE